MQPHKLWSESNKHLVTSCTDQVLITSDECLLVQVRAEQSGGGHRNPSSVQTNCSLCSDHDAAALITEQPRPEKLCISLFFYKVTDRLLNVNELRSHCMWCSEHVAPETFPRQKETEEGL